MLLYRPLESLKESSSEESKKCKVAENEGEDTVNFGNELAATICACSSHQHVHNLVPIFPIDKRVDCDCALENVIVMKSWILQSLVLPRSNILLSQLQRNYVISDLVCDDSEGEEFQAEESPDEYEK